MDVEKKKRKRKTKKEKGEMFFVAVHVILWPECRVILQLKSVKLHTVLEQIQLTFI